MQRLKELRLENGMNQTALASALSTTQSSISKFESGRNTPDIATLIKIAAYFSVSVDYLLGREDQRTSDCGLLESDIEFLNTYHLLTPSQKKKVRSFLRSINKNRKP